MGKLGEMNGAAGNQSTSLETVVKITGETQPCWMLGQGHLLPAPFFPFFFLFADTFLFFYMNRPNEIENVFPSTTDPSYNPRMAFKAAIHLLGDHVMKWFN